MKRLTLFQYVKAADMQLSDLGFFINGVYRPVSGFTKRWPFVHVAKACLTLTYQDWLIRVTPEGEVTFEPKSDLGPLLSLEQLIAGTPRGLTGFASACGLEHSQRAYKIKNTWPQVSMRTVMTVCAAYGIDAIISNPLDIKFVDPLM